MLTDTNTVFGEPVSGFSDFSYRCMESKYGLGSAQQVLAEIEKAAGIQSWTVAHIDPETRLARAIEAQDAMRRPFLRAA